jgi:hypothetical protein
MAAGSWADQVASLNRSLRAIEGHFGQSEVPPESLQALKSSVDDFRLRIWGLLSATGADQGRAFQERFRIRRAKEVCRGIASDLRTGAMDGRHGELLDLARVGSDLTRTIEQTRRALEAGGRPPLNPAPSARQDSTSG